MSGHEITFYQNSLLRALKRRSSMLPGIVNQKFETNVNYTIKLIKACPKIKV